MAQIVYTTTDGYDYLIEVPDGLVDTRLYQFGVRIGPPDLSELNLEKETERKLNNTLCERQFFEYNTLSGRRGEVQQILQEIIGIEDYAQAREVLRNLIGIYQRAAFGLGDSNYG